MMKCTNENFRNVVCLLRYWPRGAVRGMVTWTNTRKRICGDEESQFSLRDSGHARTEFAVLFRLKRLFGTKRFRKYIWYELKRLFGTKLCGRHQSGPENGVNNRPFCHRFFTNTETV